MSVAAVPDFDTQLDVRRCREKRQAERRMVGYDWTPTNPVSGEFAMQAIRVRQRLNSETLTLPQLRPFVGKEVEIVVSDVSPACDQTSTTERSPLAGSVLWYGDPFEPAVPAEEKPLKTLDSPQSRSRLAGSILRDDDDPFGPAVPAEEWEANR